jgi:hypothetical protein
MLTRASEAEVEVPVVVAMGFPRKGPTDEAKSVTNSLRESRVVLRVTKLKRTLPGEFFVPGLTEVVVVVERGDAEDQQVTRAQETGIDVYLQKKTAHAV